jgi:hypothetical protein
VYRSREQARAAQGIDAVLVAAARAYRAPRWVRPVVAGFGATPSLGLDAAHLGADPWMFGCE